MAQWSRIHLLCRRRGVRSLSREDPSEESMATHFSILAWGVNPVDGGAWRATVHGSQRAGHD